MAIDSFIDSLASFGAWLRFTPRKRSAKHDNQGRSVRGSESNPPPGFFNNAGNVIVQNPIMVEGTVNMLSHGNSVMHHLIPYMDPNAAVDSSARWPPPSCHPGTRVTVCNKLTFWLDNLARQWCFVWLYGSAGCGKSAVAQTFAEKCEELGRLGAAFFFSRPNKRNNPETVIPTIAYQLATHCSDYKALITSRLADDPQLMSKSIPVQFKKLIIEPFAHLQRHHYESVKKPLLILLDGLDECDGEAAQCEFIKLINEVVRVKKDLPFLWLICSRPEAHLQHTFTRIIDCGREELVIDDECRNDVDRYLRDGFFELQGKYNIDVSWPSQEKFEVVSEGGSGYFVYAATALGFIGDEDCANPVERLDKLVGFLSKAERDGITNPLAKLDFLYASILSDIPESIFPTTWRILAHFIYAREIANFDAKFLFESAQAMCNFINIDRNTFYSALRKLYSVIAVPAPEEAATSPFYFYHASFQDFLVDSSRSGRFVIEEKQAFVDITKSLFFWQEIDSANFHATNGLQHPREHDHASLPGLKWTSGIDTQGLSKNIATFSSWCWEGCNQSGFDEGLLSCVLQLDQRYLDLDVGWAAFVNIYKEYFPRGFYRTIPSDEFDARLLDSLRMMTNQESVKPASFPLTWREDATRAYFEYLLVGRGAMSVVVWFTEAGGHDSRMDRLNCDRMPSPDQITEYQEWLQKARLHTQDNEDADSEDESVASGFSGNKADESFKDDFKNEDSEDGVVQCVDYLPHSTSRQGDRPPTPRPPTSKSPLPETPLQPAPSPLHHTKPPINLPIDHRGEKRKVNPSPDERAKRQRRPPGETSPLTEGQPC